MLSQKHGFDLSISTIKRLNLLALLKMPEATAPPRLQTLR
jgi:hypothetical protein